MITLNDQGGASINWNYEERVDCLRANMRHHEPIVVLENEQPDNTDGEKVL